MRYDVVACHLPLQLVRRTQLREMDREAKKEGYVRSHEEYITDLNEWHNALISVTLQRGVQYLIGSACDADCADIDLFVYDGNDKLLGEESEITDVPVMDFMPRATGPHYIRVRMASCQSDPEPCSVGILVRSKK
ncbi:MAG: hypothetical protein ACNA8H_06485 [Anaerolineales bacterium]